MKLAYINCLTWADPINLLNASYNDPVVPFIAASIFFSSASFGVGVYVDFIISGWNLIVTELIAELPVSDLNSYVLKQEILFRM